MQRYPNSLITKARTLRSTGVTYADIQRTLKKNIPKSTLSDWCSDVTLPDFYTDYIQKLNLSNLHRGRAIAAVSNKHKIEKQKQDLYEKNLPISNHILNPNTAKIALAMLCLGEASKYRVGGTTVFYLGNTDPRIIVLFIELLKYCFPYDIEKVRCTVQCRADQDTKELEDYWIRVTGIPKKYFYKPQIDPRTLGKPTQKKNYKGVLKVEYHDRKVQLELESLADLSYNRISRGP
ncbi:hypothetical protein KBD71_05025 [Candidatus Woesebacteria bacterium]|nr:hypothetical protein [Candidatus Woesebacteria bacterium]